jgi:hypothetical protein
LSDCAIVADATGAEGRSNVKTSAAHGVELTHACGLKASPRVFARFLGYFNL